jgi:hypothetical protein
VYARNTVKAKDDAKATTICVRVTRIFPDEADREFTIDKLPVADAALFFFPLFLLFGFNSSKTL